MAAAAIALVAIAVWPLFNARRQAVAQIYVAPVIADYAARDRTISFYEARMRKNPQDQISAKLLGSQYMQRYRESQDVGDVLRAIHEAQLSLRLQPQNNAGADELAGSAYTALHQFGIALKYESAARSDEPDDSNAPAQMASLEMETGHYRAAAADLAAARRIRDTPTVMAVQARYDELTGNLTEARRLIARAILQTDAVVDNSAQGRAWYHFRAGELAFSSGAIEAAKAEERTALAQFPDFEMAYRALARFCWATKDWPCARDAAAKGIAIIPEPETLGYEADALSALGESVAAERTRALIVTVERVGNAYRINDRLLAVYYSEHNVRSSDALRIAQHEVRSRGTEIYAQDTLAWAAAMDGRWDVARRAAALAARYGTEDARIEYHTGMIALHFGETPKARRLLQQALKQNPQFDPFYADAARRALGEISR